MLKLAVVASERKVGPSKSDVWGPVLRSSVVRQVGQQHPATVEVSSVDFLLSLRELKAEVLEVRMHQQLFTAPPSGRVLVQAPQCEVHPLTAQLPRQLVLQRFDSPGVGNTQSTEKLVGLKYLHMPGYEVTQVLPDKL